LKGILPANLSFQGGDKLILFQIGLFSYVEETNLSVQRILSLLETGQLAHYFPLRIELVFEKNTYCKSEFSKYRKYHLLQIGLFC
jgi:hypothetical protein